MFVAYVTVPYLLAQRYWYKIEEQFSSPRMLIFWTQNLVSWFVHGSNLLGYAFIYWLNNPYLESFKDNDREWPWVYDPEFWPKVKKACKLVAFNNFVIAPIFSLGIAILSPIINKTSMADLPSFPVYLIQVFFMLMCEDFAFYNTHKFLH